MKNDQQDYALITGASSGIGKAIAEEMAQRKINLLLVALPGTGLAEVAQQISDVHQVEVKIFETDLTENDSALRLYEWSKKSCTGIRFLINNAGVGNQRSFESTPVSDLETMLKLNNQALVMLTHYFLPDLRTNTPGFILNVGSLASFMNIPNKAVYSASKSFVYSFSSSLRIELKPYNISVSCLCPGVTLTNARIVGNCKKIRFATKGIFQKPDDVARKAVQQMFRKQKRIITGRHNQFVFMLWRLLPEAIVERILSALFFHTKMQSIPKRRGIYARASSLFGLAVN